MCLPLVPAGKPIAANTLTGTPYITATPNAAEAVIAVSADDKEEEEGKKLYEEIFKTTSDAAIAKFDRFV
jgi:hypothetical protein